MSSIKCTVCSRVAKISKDYTIAGKPVSLLECGHAFSHKFLGARAESIDTVTSLDGKRPFGYQKTGVEFIENSNGRCIIGDEMRLGKTVQALTALRLHPEMLPAIAVVKASTLIQWQRECMRWIHEDFIAQIVDGGVFLPGCKMYLLSYDALASISGTRKRKREIKASMIKSMKENDGYIISVNLPKEENGLVKRIKEIGIKTLILDEVQQIKNTESQRTQECRELSKHVEYVLALSGTPIKNHAGEFFPVLNIVKPEAFPTEAGYQRDYCSYYTTSSGTIKIAGLRDPDKFKEVTKKFFIRRTRAEVMPQMPKIFRSFSFHELGKEVKEAYKKLLREFQDSQDQEGMSGMEKSANDLAFMSRMRHLTGISKVNPCIDHIMEYLGSSDKGKVCIFVHHKDVGDLLAIKLKPILDELGMELRQLTSDIPVEKRQQIVDDFRVQDNLRVAIASTLSIGEGLTMNMFEHFVMLERQWNPANEEQAESRFPHVEGTSSINGMYLVATGTIDEFFATLVERKREFVGQTLDGYAVRWDQTDIMKELSQKLLESVYA